MILDVNRLVSVWRGNTTPPTLYHIWIKENNTIWYYKDGWTLLVASDDSYNEIKLRLDELEANIDENYYTKEEANSTFITEETDPTVPSWAKQSTKPTYQTSELINDSGFITIADVPTKTSLLKNDSGYVTSSAIPTNVSLLKNDALYVTASSIPTKVSQLKNDAEYITAEDVPTKVSELKNDALYITSSDIPTALSAFTNDTNYITKEEAEKIANGLDVYSKEETNKLVEDKIEELKDGIPTIIEQKALEVLDGIDVYTKEETTQLVEEKITELEGGIPNIVEQEVSNLIENAVSTVIDNVIEEKNLVTKEELSTKADINSPEFQGIPIVPTAATDVAEDSTLIANIAWVTNKLNSTLAAQNLQLYAESVNDVAQLELQDNFGNTNSVLLIVGSNGVSITTDKDNVKLVTVSLGSHASTSSTYGLSSTTEYGHTKIVNDFEKDDFGTVIEPTILNGVAASPHLVYEAVKDAISVVSPDTWRPVEAVTEETMDNSENLIQEVLNEESADKDQTLKFGPGLLMKDGIIDISWTEILGNNIKYKN